MRNEKIDVLLSKKTISNYKKAVKLILDNNLTQYGVFLLEYVQELLVTKKSWSTICLIFDTLGLLNYKKAINITRKICEADKDEDIITTCATKAYIRLSRRHKHDVSNVIKVLQNSKSHSVKEGVFWSLGQDKIVPSIKEQKLLIEIGKNLETNKLTGRVDLRQGLAAACAGWDDIIVKDFLEKCKNSSYMPLKFAAEQALKKKYPNNW